MNDLYMVATPNGYKLSIALEDRSGIPGVEGLNISPLGWIEWQRGQSARGGHASAGTEPDRGG